MNLLESIEYSIGLGIGQILIMAIPLYLIVMAICLIAIWFKMLKAKLKGHEVNWEPKDWEM